MVPFWSSTGSFSQWAVGKRQKPSWVYWPDTPGGHFNSTSPGAEGTQGKCLSIGDTGLLHFKVPQLFQGWEGGFRWGMVKWPQSVPCDILCPHLTPCLVGGKGRALGPLSCTCGCPNTPCFLFDFSFSQFKLDLPQGQRRVWDSGCTSKSYILGLVLIFFLLSSQHSAKPSFSWGMAWNLFVAAWIGQSNRTYGGQSSCRYVRILSRNILYHLSALGPLTVCLVFPFSLWPRSWNIKI